MFQGLRFELKSAGDLRIEFPASQTSASLNATDVDRLISTLANFRANMQPEVPRSPPAQIPGQNKPLSAVYDIPVLPGKVLAIRHGMLGWLSFQFPQPEANKLGIALQGQSAPKTTKRTRSPKK